ncbi:MAG: cytochrome c oxidase assembly protein [Alphaproteobacteria bacterium]|nr:cytochrome c oxidase assembly protein [Alphaproteobacteria bacterium]
MKRRNRKVFLFCVFVFFCMISLSFASVPLYRLFCQTTGFGGTPLVALRNDSVVSEGIIEVRFDSNIAPELPWTFVPRERSVHVRFGETTLVFYRVRNNSSRSVSGTATFNVTPNWLSPYFNKIECFCFTEQTVGPYETVDMPVTFFIDPLLVREEVFRKYQRSGNLPAITLSYTFFPLDDEEAGLRAFLNISVRERILGPRFPHSAIILGLGDIR